jgi:rhodanese-related sulfurtransferase
MSLDRKIKYITAQDLKKILWGEEVYSLIDVRSQKEYEEGQIFGATRIAVNVISQNLPLMIQNKKTQIILYSNSEGRAVTAAEALTDLGYESIYILKGGLEAWKKAGLYTVIGIHVQSKALGEVVDIRPGSVKHIQAKELIQKIKESPEDKKPVILEVRPIDEVQQTGSIKGAINIPGVELYPKLKKYLDLGREVVLTCAGRTRSIIAAATVNALGFGDVYELVNGTRGWILEGEELSYDTEVDDTPVSPESKIWFTKKAKELSKSSSLAYIAAEELKYIVRNLKNTNTIILDVRQRDDYERRGHIPGSRNYEGGQIIQNTDDALLINGADYVLVDDGDGRAEIVAFWLKELAIPNVKILSGGINEWLAKGYDLVSGSTVLAIDTGAHHEGALIRDPIIEANNYIEWESALTRKREYMEYFRSKGIV